MSWQTVLYKPQKGGTPNTLKEEFIEQLIEASSQIGDDEFLQIPLKDVQEGFSRETTAKASSLAQTLPRKYENIRVVRANASSDHILMRVKDTAEPVELKE